MAAASLRFADIDSDIFHRRECCIFDPNSLVHHSFPLASNRRPLPKKAFDIVSLAEKSEEGEYLAKMDHRKNSAFY